jgi:hypothetical protein
MDQLIRVLNDDDRQAVDWLQKHVGEARLAAVARQLTHSGKRPFVSAVCRHLGVWPPAASRVPPRGRDRRVAQQHLAQIRQLLARQSAAKMHTQDRNV